MERRRRTSQTHPGHDQDTHRATQTGRGREGTENHTQRAKTMPGRRQRERKEEKKKRAYLAQPSDVPTLDMEKNKDGEIEDSDHQHTNTAVL